MSRLNNVSTDHLDYLESESIYIFREAASLFENPVMLYSVGKDSSVLLHLARKAFEPANIPFPLMHIDTGHKFPEMYSFRDAVVQKYGVRLIIGGIQDSNPLEDNPYKKSIQNCCGLLKTKALVDSLKHGEFDCAFGGARRDEERSRAKERVFSYRNEFSGWDPRKQRPELWSLYNSRIQKGESMRVFPLSDWTEIDIWSYIAREKIPVSPLYFAKERRVVKRAGQWIPYEGVVKDMEDSTPETISCRYRTLGCMPCTGAIPSNAQSVEDIILEMAETRVSERSTRVIDHDRDGSMELKKQQGYF